MLGTRYGRVAGRMDKNEMSSVEYFSQLTLKNRIILAAAERSASFGLGAALSVLRWLLLEDFGALLISMPDNHFPNLSRVLPRMASEEVQAAWTAAKGFALLEQTIVFMRLVSDRYEKLTGKKMRDARILDFGCGYGRLMRTMAYHADPAQIYGCDPWQNSIDIAMNDGMFGHLALSARVPDQLPFPGTFDLIYAYSVFTHLPEPIAARCLQTLADALAPQGLLVITIRPIEYWAVSPYKHQEQLRDEKMHEHRTRGFAFVPHGWEPIDGVVPFGDASFVPEWVERTIPRLQLADRPRGGGPLQTTISLKRRG